MASYNQSGGGGPDDHLNAMLARLRANHQQQQGQGQGERSYKDTEDLSRLALSLNQDYLVSPASEHQDASASDVFPPPAPTPPASHFSHSHGPPGMSNLGPIGSLPGSLANNNSGKQANQSVNLLGLLKFNPAGNKSTLAPANQTLSQPSPLSHHQSASSLEQSMNFSHGGLQPTLHAPVPIQGDPQGYLASLMKGDSQMESARTDEQAHASAPAPPEWNTGNPADETQAYLLSLLQKKKPSQTDEPYLAESSSHPDLSAHSNMLKENNNGDLSELLSREQPQMAPQDPHYSLQAELQQQQQPYSPSASIKNEYASQSSQNGATRKSTMFDYNNPFEDLASYSPQNKASKSSTPGQQTAPSIQILKKAPSTASSPGANDNKRHSFQRSHVTSPEHSRQSPSSLRVQHQPDAPEVSHKETVSEAIDGLAETADREAQEAIAQMEHEEAQAQIVQDLDEMIRAKSNSEFDEKSELAARDIQRELEKEGNSGLLERSMSPTTAQAVRDIVDEAANGHGPVADSWESADADEIVVIEEEPTPVKVYNFPMKPWISISLQENEESRPQFREEVILDIARVKKEFDQIDRNLVSSTKSFIVYGMSKAGGIRVIRQDDGRDAKLFTETKDRIFNIAVSSTPADIHTAQKEAIIGTGISGTVYHILLRNGDKDYIDDAHPEQYGFALPPISTHEGDAPGGVLKTRARTSCAHPEYFAVGRGKTISIIWPSYIMKHKLFKPGHDRVVDTEKLSKQCSLRINTGKAGKDFTFSQDDSTIVSLDKSGRVKFWDVRDLTAVDEGSDPRFPMPAQTSLEVREPLMTLTTTPEGEKAWPTSVLLLDKQRPYQKRCALRYMIVGMKQNHTLQLWDLALGKPVQEFNLPHSKESDAVCSVMYHPPTGMIVVGHPTRNSVYFLHLSAPKYTIKGLSQVDYVQKLVAKDASIPEPDSTAVISGVREYSFANKGVIRSLDMLATPAAELEKDEQTLFELYVMHSKGVSNICIKQSELGWTRDNKVIAPVDAIETGIVKITKLKELPSTQPTETQPVEDPTTLPIRIAARPNLKENISPQPQLGSGQEDTNRKSADDLTTATRQQPERKASEAPVTPNNQTEKSDRRSRKKREKAAAAAAAAEKQSNSQDPIQSTSSAHSPRVGPTMAKNEAKTSASSQSNALPDSLQSAVKQIEMTLSGVVESALVENRQKMDDDLRSRDQAFNKSQLDLLDSVSATLDDNVSRLLTRTISDKVEEYVVPEVNELITRTITEQLARTVTEQIDSKVSGRISHAVQNQMQKLLPAAVSQAIQKPELAKVVTEKIGQSLSVNIEKAFMDALHKTVTPNFTRMAATAAGQAVENVRRQAAEQIGELELKSRSDSNKIDQLTALVTRLSDTVSSMAATQAQFHEAFLKMQQPAASRERPSREVSHSQYSQASQGPSYSNMQAQNYPSPSAHSNNQMMLRNTAGSNSSKDHDLDRKVVDIANLVERGELEAALVKWLQSDRKDDIFKTYLIKLDATTLNELSPLVSLAAIAELARELGGQCLREKVAWMEIIIRSMHDTLPHIESQVREVVPNILGGCVSQIEQLFMRINHLSPQEPILRHLSQMMNMANTIVEFASKPNMNLGGY
ncbi:hypothetical protein PG997_001294 [Apiospora hydei]|uniref:EDC4-like protein pdc1 beta-propeller domain-containing protein n=1 Tax=Apiospora hydei TaxID=1337664 RepID=A0ABR1XDD9_9PEZI